MADLVAAALLHDALEDQGISRKAIAAMFGEESLGSCLEVTDDTSLPQEVRKRLQVDQAPRKPRRAILKLADKISNVAAIGREPAGGLADRARTRLRGMGVRRRCRPSGRLARIRANVRRLRRRSCALFGARPR